MAKTRTARPSGLRCRIIAAFILAVVLFGVSTTIVSPRILRATLTREGLAEDAAQRVAQRLSQMLTGFTVAGTLAAAVLAVLLARTITDPIQRLLDAVTDLHSGNLDTRVAVRGQDDFARLATAFNQLAQAVQQCHTRLETEVSQRTEQLQTANRQLEGQVAERCRAEEAIRENEECLRRILDSMCAGVLVIDPQTHTILDANQVAAEQVGLDKSEIIGRVCHEFVCPAECGACPITDLGQVVDRSQRVLKRADGQWLPVLKSVAHMTLHGRECLLESFVDIAARKQAEDELKESVSLLKATLESTADGILVVDGYGAIKNFNKQFRELWRLPSEVLDTMDDNQALASALPGLTDPDAFLARVKQLWRHREQEDNGTLHFRDGRVAEYCSKPQYLGDQITGRVWSFRDVTDRHSAQKEQDKLLQQVAAINEELSHFAYVVSHDLKAPLRGIRMLTEWLCTDYRDRFDDEARENLALLENRVERMHNLIEGVLQYSRVGRIKEDVVEIDLGALLPDIIDAIAPPDHVAICIEGRLPAIECEKTRITQVFQNLLTNAVKYMDKPAGRIVVACTEDHDAWTFSVSDNGPGIEEKHFERIFKIFQTLAPRDEFESTGVGLTLVKKIVEHYGGRIWVASEVGQGSTFFFTLPRPQTPTEAAVTSIDTVAAAMDGTHHLEHHASVAAPEQVQPRESS
jgi:two-component system sensor kinase FixL